MGELAALNWDDIDFDEGLIHVRHTLVYYDHGNGKGCHYEIHTPKTEAGERRIPMLDEVREALFAERQYHEDAGIQCVVTIGGLSDFVFLNRYGSVFYQSSLNKAIRRIVRDCNEQQLEKGSNLLLPAFTCHSLRHTFTTRLVENGVNIKVVQETLGHKDVETTLNVYTHVSKDLQKQAFDDLQRKMKKGKKGFDESED